MNRFLDRWIVRILDLANILHGFSDLIILVQRIYLGCNLVRILDCDFIVELLVDPN